MARPRKSGMDYFPHDVNLWSDFKVEMLRTLYGNNGYAFYCIMLEHIYQQPEYELLVDEDMFKILAKRIKVSVPLLKKMIETSVKHNCFEEKLWKSEKKLTSHGIKKRTVVVEKKRATMRDSYNSGQISDGVSDAETQPEMPQRKVKVKESIKTYTPNEPLPAAPAVEGNKFSDEWEAQFKVLWDAYPKKAGKGDALKWYKRYYFQDCKGSVDVGFILDRIETYRKYCVLTERKVKDGSTFFNQKSWEEDWTSLLKEAQGGGKQQQSQKPPEPQIETNGEPDPVFVAYLEQKRMEKEGATA